MNTKETTDIIKVNRACPSLEKGSHKNTAAVPFIFATHAVQHHTPPVFFFAEFIFNYGSSSTSTLLLNFFNTPLNPGF